MRGWAAPASPSPTLAAPGRPRELLGMFRGIKDGDAHLTFGGLETHRLDVPHGPLYEDDHDDLLSPEQPTPEALRALTHSSHAPRGASSLPTPERRRTVHPPGTGTGRAPRHRRTPRCPPSATTSLTHRGFRLLYAASPGRYRTYASTSEPTLPPGAALLSQGLFYPFGLLGDRLGLFWRP